MGLLRNLLHITAALLIATGITGFFARMWLMRMVLQLPTEVITSPIGDMLAHSIESPWMVIGIGALLLWITQYIGR